MRTSNARAAWKVRLSVWLPCLLCAAVALSVDQACKVFLKDSSAVLIPGVIALVSPLHNMGMAFSFLNGVPWAGYVLPPLALMLAAFLLRGQLTGSLRGAFFGLVIGGALSNYLDRVFLGFVRDQFEFLFIRFPVFNAADAALTVGLFGLAACLAFSPNREERDVQ